MMIIKYWSPFLIVGGLLLLLTSCSNNYLAWHEKVDTNKFAILQKQQQKIAKKMATQYTKYRPYIIRKQISKQKLSHTYSKNKKISIKSFFQEITFPCDMLCLLNDTLDWKNKKILLRCSNIAIKEKASAIILRPLNLKTSKKILIQIQNFLKKNHILHINIQPNKSFYLHKKNTIQKESNIIMIDLDFQNDK